MDDNDDDDGGGGRLNDCIDIYLWCMYVCNIRPRNILSSMIQFLV